MLHGYGLEGVDHSVECNRHLAAQGITGISGIGRIVHTGTGCGGSSVTSGTLGQKTTATITSANYGSSDKTKDIFHISYIKYHLFTLKC